MYVTNIRVKHTYINVYPSWSGLKYVPSTRGLTYLRRLNGTVFRRDHKNRGSFHSTCGSVNIPTCSEVVSVEQRPKLCSPSPAIVTQNRSKGTAKQPLNNRQSKKQTCDKHHCTAKHQGILWFNDKKEFLIYLYLVYQMPKRNHYIISPLVAMSIAYLIPLSSYQSNSFATIPAVHAVFVGNSKLILW